MTWMIISFAVALAISLLGVLIVGGAFDIVAKVIFWLVVCIFLGAQTAHVFHLIRLRKGG